MKHSIISRRFIGGREWSVMVHILAETPSEQKAILHLNKGVANEKEMHLIDKYLASSLALGNYSLIRVINRINTTYTLLVQIN
jgi:hypothetical protein